MLNHIVVVAKPLIDLINRLFKMGSVIRNSRALRKLFIAPSVFSYRTSMFYLIFNPVLVLDLSFRDIHALSFWNTFDLYPSRIVMKYNLNAVTCSCIISVSECSLLYF